MSSVHPTTPADPLPGPGQLSSLCLHTLLGPAAAGSLLGQPSRKELTYLETKPQAGSSLWVTDEQVRRGPEGHYQLQPQR